MDVQISPQEYQIFDELQIMQNDKFKKNFFQPTTEKVLYSNYIIKINKRESSQKRTIIITNYGLYNVDNKDVKRKFEIFLIEGITISKTSEEFVIHVKNSYDYRYQCESGQREILLKQIIYVYQQLKNNQNMPIYITDEQKLHQFCSHEDDVKKGQKVNDKKPKWDPEMASYERLNIFLSNQLLKSKFGRVLFINNPNIFKVWLEDFNMKYQLAEGSLSNIYLVNYKTDQEKRYCLKVIKEEQLGKTNPDELQNQIVTHENMPFIEQLEFAFMKKNDFYFLFKVYKGRDLFTLISMKVQLKEAQYKFYFIEILLGLKAFHQKNIIYGDLKPENVLIDDQGHVALTDFGICRGIENKSDDEIALTLEYTSPEILKGSLRSFSSDFWALGCLLYEMAVGIVPFYHENQNLIMHLIVNNQINYPPKTIQDNNMEISDECKDLITKLLQSDPNQRINLSGILKHPWLKGVDWTMYETNCNLTRPNNLWKPEPMKNAQNQPQYLNYSYFDYNKFTKEIPIDQYDAF